MLKQLGLTAETTPYSEQTDSPDRHGASEDRNVNESSTLRKALQDLILAVSGNNDQEDVASLRIASSPSGDTSGQLIELRSPQIPADLANALQQVRLRRKTLSPNWKINHQSSESYGAPQDADHSILEQVLKQINPEMSMGEDGMVTLTMLPPALTRPQTTPLHEKETFARSTPPVPVRGAPTRHEYLINRSSTRPFADKLPKKSIIREIPSQQPPELFPSPQKVKFKDNHSEPSRPNVNGSEELDIEVAHSDFESANLIVDATSASDTSTEILISSPLSFGTRIKSASVNKNIANVLPPTAFRALVMSSDSGSSTNAACSSSSRKKPPDDRSSKPDIRTDYLHMDEATQQIEDSDVSAVQYQNSTSLQSRTAPLQDNQVTEITGKKRSRDLGTVRKAVEESVSNKSEGLSVIIPETTKRPRKDTMSPSWITPRPAASLDSPVRSNLNKVQITDNYIEIATKPVAFKKVPKNVKRKTQMAKRTAGKPSAEELDNSKRIAVGKVLTVSAPTLPKSHTTSAWDTNDKLTAEQDFSADEMDMPVTVDLVEETRRPSDTDDNLDEVEALPSMSELAMARKNVRDRHSFGVQAVVGEPHKRRGELLGKQRNKKSRLRRISITELRNVVEEVPSDLDKKIAVENGDRRRQRAKRVRIPPLQWWKNERIEYEATELMGVVAYRAKAVYRVDEDSGQPAAEVGEVAIESGRSSKGAAKKRIESLPGRVLDNSENRVVALVDPIETLASGAAHKLLLDAPMIGSLDGVWQQRLNGSLSKNVGSRVVRWRSMAWIIVDSGSGNGYKVRQ